MKKILAILIVALMICSLAGCDSSKYKKAVELYDSGDYQAAIVIFSELGDYEDSAKYLKDAKWYALIDYMKNNGQYADGRYLLTKSVLSDDVNRMAGIGVSTSKPDELYLSIVEKIGSSGVELSYICGLYCNKNSIEGTYFFESEMNVYSAYTKSSAYGHVDVSNITSATKLDCRSNISSEVKDIYGKVSYDQNLNHHASLLEHSQELLPDLLKSCEAILTGTGISITLADLGFTSYK